jgi:hypothetical protein
MVCFQGRVMECQVVEGFLNEKVTFVLQLVIIYFSVYSQ